MKRLLPCLAFAALAVGAADAYAFGNNTNTNINGNANANVNKNSNSNYNSNRNSARASNRNTNIIGVGTAQQQKQSSKHNNNTDVNITEEGDDAAATTGSLGLGQGSSTSTGLGNKICVAANGDTQSWGFGGSGGTLPGTGQGLFSRYTSEALVGMVCMAENDEDRFLAQGKREEAHYSACTIPTRRKAMEFVTPGTCNNIPVIARLTILSESQTVEDAYTYPESATPSVAMVEPAGFKRAAPVAQPRTSGNAKPGNTGGCAAGFNYSTGQCNKVQASTDMREDA